jgi:hypothetical protein
VVKLLCFLCLFVAGPFRTEGASENCYRESDERDIRLWQGDAPGASGKSPCRDIPLVRLYPGANRTGPAGPAILIIPGGGYDRLSDTKEQAPVAEYFSHDLGLVTFILYYRLVQPDGTYRYPIPLWDATGAQVNSIPRARVRDRSKSRRTFRVFRGWPLGCDARLAFRLRF